MASGRFGWVEGMRQVRPSALCALKQSAMGPALNRRHWFFWNGITFPYHWQVTS
ncbi:hypothetical protein [Photorhabdus hindustanensis]|uniref:hypothetical protein n=1 Tax=Photorhabdus hindustanensis TaxID=2918802 RepID=UPI0013649752|nr:hypothetical protein [Photorhabdus hindustanensis]